MWTHVLPVVRDNKTSYESTRTLIDLTLCFNQFFFSTSLTSMLSFLFVRYFVFTFSFSEHVPSDHLLLERSPNIGPLISRCIDKYKNCWNKSFRTSKILTLLYQQFSDSLISQRDMSGPRLGALSNNRWLGGTVSNCIWMRWESNMNCQIIILTSFMFCLGACVNYCSRRGPTETTRRRPGVGRRCGWPRPWATAPSSSSSSTTTATSTGSTQKGAPSSPSLLLRYNQRDTLRSYYTPCVKVGIHQPLYNIFRVLGS